MKELKWKFLDEIEGFEDYSDYVIFENGDLYSFKTNKWLTRKHNVRGYIEYHLVDDFGNQFFITAHILVAKAFIPNPNNLPTVDHIDRNRENNSVENLRWASYKTQNENRESSKTRETKRIHDRTTGCVYKNCVEAAKAIEGNRQNIWDCCNGILKSYKGHVFNYVD